MLEKFKKQKSQKWFNNNYSNEEIDIDISGEENLTESLKIENFTKLQNINLKSLNLTSLEIVGCSQLIKVDLSELTKLKSLFVSKCPSLTKLDCSHSQLSGLAELDVNNLIELDCSNTLIEKLSLNLCPDIIKLNCSNNNKLISLDVSNCSKLKNLDCSNTSLTSFDLRNCPKDIEVINHPIFNIIREKGIKNLLVVGYTNSGKSTLCNVLAGTDEFTESAYTTSETESFQKKIFEWKGTKYRVVDNIGVMNTGLPTDKVLHRMAEGIYSIPEGISQILFLIDKTFSVSEKKKIELFSKFIFESGIAKYTTIVRTKFPNFNSPVECKKDKKLLCKDIKIIDKLVKSRKNSIIHVDNPPIKILIDDDDDDGSVKELIGINKRRREMSRETLLKYLEKVCQNQYFKISTWDKINAKFELIKPFQQS